MELPSHAWQFSQRPQRWRMWAVLLALNLAALWLLARVLRGEITYQTLFPPTPTPTRSPQSWAMEAQALFEAGDLEAAIQAYQQALRIAPENGQLWADLARTLVYSSAMLTTDQAQYERLQEAVRAADRAVEADKESSYTYAVRAFALDWLATNPLSTAEARSAALRRAETDAARALVLDPNNALALAYYAEVLLDQQRWLQAEEQAVKAVERGPDLMDTHRVYAYVLESLGRYREAIDQYLEAIRIAPNMTFLYLHVGFNYRYLASQATAKVARDRLYQLALEYFDRAVRINNRLGIQDPVPYIAIAKTYAQQGEFFAAARNAERALLIDPSDPLAYAQLGVIYVKARNYEGSIPLFKCVVEGCSPQETKAILDTLAEKFGEDPDAYQGVAIEPMPMTNITVAYFYAQYGAVLAALDQCQKALPVLALVEERFGNDPGLRNVIQESRNICRILQQPAHPGPTPTPMYPTPEP